MLRSTTALLLVLGALGSLAAAQLSASLFGLSLRQQFFPAALVAGLTLLVLMRAGDTRGQRPAQGTRTTTGASGKAASTVTQLLQKDGALPAEAARAWLDEFLLEQQK